MIDDDKLITWLPYMDYAQFFASALQTLKWLKPHAGSKAEQKTDQLIQIHCSCWLEFLNKDMGKWLVVGLPCE